MKKREKRELREKGKAGVFNSKIWICIISVILCLAVVSVICVGTVNGIVYLKEENETAQKEINSLRTKLAQSNAELQITKDDQTQMREDIESLNALLNSLKLSLDAVEDANKSAQKEIDSLKESNQAANEEIASLKESNQKANEEIENLKNMLESSPEEKIRIYIDQGHNPSSYHNSGAEGNGLYEQDVTFNIGCLLAELLRKDGRFEVCLSRSNKSVVLGTDNLSSLKARVNGAVEFGADYFISLHTNSFNQSDVNGLEVYVTEERSTSYTFGSSLLKGMADATGLKNRGMKLGNSLYVIENVTMPAALLEMGFITNSQDAALMSARPELFAEGIYNGILDYFGFK